MLSVTASAFAPIAAPPHPSPACSAQERDDLRKRTRQERLHELRTGCRASWVELERGGPPQRPAALPPAA